MSQWQDSQQHELSYIQKSESKTWKMHSLKYWMNFLDLASIHGHGIEIGCGNNGLYNFTNCVLGIDTIKFKKSNFVQASAEHLPVEQTDFAILCNSLDHCENPEKVLNEVSRVTNTLILWTYIYPKDVSFLLQKFDKMHPYHFTVPYISYLLTKIRFSASLRSTGSPLIFWKHTKSLKMKIKLLIMRLFNIKYICVHLRCVE